MIGRLCTSMLVITAASLVSTDGECRSESVPQPPSDKLITTPAGTRPRVFRIHVVEEGTGRGVPLVELKTVNQIRHVTDSNGIVAFDEPGLFNRKVFFTITSHGYEVEKDAFGYRGKALEITEGGSADIVIHRLNMARRLYRVTGAGIYRDSVLTGDAVPIREPLLNGKVFGQDSVVNAVFQGKIHWFWGDTNRPDYPLGNFHVPGATSELPGQGGLEPEVGVNLLYFLDDQGFARPTAPMPGEGPTWISGLVVLKDRQARERMFAVYAKIRKCSKFMSAALPNLIRKRNGSKRSPSFPKRPHTSANSPTGIRSCIRTRASNTSIMPRLIPWSACRPTPSVSRTPVLARHIRASNRELGCPKQHFDRGPDGRLRYGWKTNTPLLRQDQQTKLIVARRIKPEEALLNLRDIDSGKVVVAHGGSVYWNAYRGRWVMICVESYGSTSLLGEVWYAEADTPLGPWVYARKIVTHDKYSFYNPKQHPMFDKDGGRIIFFEGTYTTTFSGNPDPTPRYDYNQVMYQLDLSDPRLALPVAIYEVAVGPRTAGSAGHEDVAGRRQAADRRGPSPSSRRPPGDRLAAGL